MKTELMQMSAYRSNIVAVDLNVTKTKFLLAIFSNISHLLHFTLVSLSETYNQQNLNTFVLAAWNNDIQINLWSVHWYSSLLLRPYEVMQKTKKKVSQTLWILTKPWKSTTSFEHYREMRWIFIYQKTSYQSIINPEYALFNSFYFRKSAS